MSQLFITIEEPCGENWNEMNPSENGRLCAHCSKEVIDFSSFSDNEIIAYIEKNKGKLLCGNFEPGQLNRRMESSELKTINPLLYKFLMSVFLLAASQNSLAQTKKELPDTVQRQTKSCGDSIEVSSVVKTPSNVFENNFHVRGILSLRSNDSMLVVDGAPTEMGWLKKIPANKIKTKTILKGATAAAIYGPEAANGVTIITTSFTKRQRRQFFRKK